MSKFKVGARVFFNSKCVDWLVPKEAIGKTGVVTTYEGEASDDDDDPVGTYTVTLDSPVLKNTDWYVHDLGITLVQSIDETKPPQPEQKGTSMKFKTWTFEHSPVKKQLTLADVPEVDKNGEEIWYGVVLKKAVTASISTVCCKHGDVYWSRSEGDYVKTDAFEKEDFIVVGIVNRPGQDNKLPDVVDSMSTADIPLGRCIALCEDGQTTIVWKVGERHHQRMNSSGYICRDIATKYFGKVLDLVAVEKEIEVPCE